jgi:hypothetical protein
LVRDRRIKSDGTQQAALPRQAVGRILTRPQEGAGANVCRTARSARSQRAWAAESFGPDSFILFFLLQITVLTIFVKILSKLLRVFSIQIIPTKI